MHTYQLWFITLDWHDPYGQPVDAFAVIADSAEQAMTLSINAAAAYGMLCVKFRKVEKGPILWTGMAHD